METIGPVYMIACGCPVPAADHASRLATLALEIRDYGASLFVNDEPVHLKMGIHSGSVSLFLFCASLDRQRKTSGQAKNRISPFRISFWPWAG